MYIFYLLQILALLFPLLFVITLHWPSLRSSTCFSRILSIRSWFRLFPHTGILFSQALPLLNTHLTTFHLKVTPLVKPSFSPTIAHKILLPTQTNLSQKRIGTFILFFIVVVPIYMPINSATNRTNKDFLFSTPLKILLSCFLDNL